MLAFNLAALLAEVREGMVEDELQLKLEISGILRSSSEEFAALVEERANVD